MTSPAAAPTLAATTRLGATHLTVSDLAIAALDRAREPKRLAILPGGHFDAYVAGFDAASRVARDWFAAHLRAGT